jgi:branched-chain amino acid aminotransferase
MDLSDPSSTRVTIVTADGHAVLGRLKDFAGVPLRPTLYPTGDVLAFVSGSVVARAKALLNGEAGDLGAEATKAAERFRGDLAASDCPIVPVQPVDFAALPFGLNFTHAMIYISFPRGKAPKLGEIDLASHVYPYEKITIPPAAVVLNYGQEVFEGMKAFRAKDGSIVLFAPWLNAERIANSARRTSLTPLDKNLFLAAVKQFVLANEHLVPPYREGELYIRPLQIGRGEKLGVSPADEEALLIFGSPVGPYYPGGLTTGIRVLVQKEYHRVGRGGLGSSKAGGNYVSGMLVDAIAHENGCQAVLWLDAVHKRFIEEAGTSNFWYLSGNEREGWVLHTPALTDTILPGTTLKILLTLAERMKIRVVEEVIDVNEAAKAVAVFTTGTAAVITPVTEFLMDGQVRQIGNGKVHPLVLALYEELVLTQRGERNQDLGLVVVIKEGQQAA